MKGEETRSTILDAALRMARLEGLDAISIGQLASRVGLSKSGLFAHFRSKEALQLQVLQLASSIFVDKVVRPALSAPRGVARLQAMFENWLSWADQGAGKGGCVFLGAAIEYDDKPGTVRDFLVETQNDWIGTLARAVRIAREEGHLRAATDEQQLAFEIYGFMMAYHLYRRLLGDRTAAARARASFERLLAENR